MTPSSTAATNGGLTTRNRDGRPRTSTSTSSPSATERSSSASAMPLRRLGENVPAGDLAHRSRRRADTVMCARGMPRSRPSRPQSSRRGARLLLGEQRVAAPERRLLPAHRPAAARLDRGDVQREVLPVQRVAHLGAQRVAGAEAAGPDAVRRAGLEQRVPQRGGVVPRAAAARSRARRCSRCGRRRPATRASRSARTTCSRAGRHRWAGRARRAPRRCAGPARRARRSRSCRSRTSTPSGAAAASRRTTSAVFAAFGMRKTSSSPR